MGVVDAPEGVHLVGSKRVYTIKYKLDRSTERYKHSCSENLWQKIWYKVSEDFASVAKMNTILVILVLAVFRG